MSELVDSVIDIKPEVELKSWHYQQAIWSIDPGAVNVSGLTHSLCDWIGLIEADLNEWDRKVEGVLFDIRFTCQRAWAEGNVSTGEVNTNKHVVEHVTRLANYAFRTEDLRHVASHPIIRLVVSQMAQLAGVIVNDPLYFDRWRDAYEEAKEKSVDVRQ